MRRAKALAGGAAIALMLTLTACGEEGSGDEPQTEESTSPAATAPAQLSYDTPDGFTSVSNAQVEYPLAEQYEATALQLDDASSNEMIFVVSYLLDPDIPTETRNHREAILADYDKVLGNLDEGAVNTALVGGDEGLFRRALYANSSGKRVYQDNTYLFHGNQVIQITCQWDEKDSTPEIRTAMYEGCQGVQENLEITN
ncbi:MAG TPA: hypothetical protein H9881_13075 [Candidatus Stackebrandtia excrementipullorum]|nr:hypothetical protein [Candidatus Stackebrandtia excrementipullorum]